MLDKGFIEQEVVRVLKTVFDPEIPVDIYELGLIYEIKVNDEGALNIKMTLTSPACPVAESIPVEVRDKVKGIHGITDVNVELVWEPTWTQDMMSEEAKLQLGFF